MPMTSSKPIIVFWLDPGASAIRTVIDNFMELPAARRDDKDAAAIMSSRRVSMAVIMPPIDPESSYLQTTFNVFVRMLPAGRLDADDLAIASGSEANES